MRKNQMTFAAVLGLTALAGVASAETIYGITNTHLVSFDTAAPGAVSVVGAFNLGANYTRVFNLAYNKSDGFFYGLGWRDQTDPNTATQTLVRINATTGAASEVASYGLSTGQTLEGLEFNSSLNTLVSARGNFFDTTEYVAISNAGVINSIVNNNVDNDHTVYDSTRNLTYNWDPNGVAQWTKTNLGTGATQQFGSALAFGDGAYSSAQDKFFVYQTAFAGPYFLHEVTADGINPITVNTVGMIGNTTVGDITGLAFIPSPGAIVLLALGGLTATRRRR